MLNRVQIKQNAKAAFSAAYWPCVGALVLVSLIFAAAGSLSVIFIGGVAAIFLMPLYVGEAGFFLGVFRRDGDPNIGRLFNIAFSQNYMRKLGGMLWMELFVFLWSLLFVIPGLIKALAYMMTPYILADCPNVDAKSALKLSMRMTKGYKGDLFVMGLSFIGWMLLSSLTFGILHLFYVGPYMSASFAGAYDELKQKALASGTISPAEFDGQVA